MACSSCVTAARQPLPPPWRNLRVVTSATSGLLLMIGVIGGRLEIPSAAETSIYLLAVFIGGGFFAREALEDLVKEHEVGIELLMTVAALVAGAMGQWAEAAMLVFLYSISEAAEGYTAERTRHAIRALMDLAPKTALVVREGRELQVPAESLAVGDIFIVRPGEAVATDGEIIAGRSSLNQAPVTGESIPVEKAVGDAVFAATLNGEGALTVRATRTVADNTLARIIQLVEQAQASKGRSQRFIERFGHRYSPVVLAVGVLLALVPGLLGWGWQEWMTRATVFIVAAAPCALVISIPITLVAAIGTAGRQGILIKGGVHLENLARVQVIALDKTGTLTRGEPRVTTIVGLNEQPEREVLRLAAALEARSQHPLARAILQAATEQDVNAVPASDFQALTGAGATGRVEGRALFIGSPTWFAGKYAIPADIQQRLETLQTAGNTVVILGDEQRLLGLIAIADPLRSEAVQAIADLKRAGIRKIVMLTGDNPRTARAIADQAGIDEVLAELKPEDKTRQIKALEAAYGRVAMVGDGVNDAPALAAAHVGIAMGVAGTDVALETADIALMADNLERLPYLIRFSRRNWMVIRQNLALSVVVIGALIVGAVTGAFALPVTVLAHEVSEFIVIASGLRMLRA